MKTIVRTKLLLALCGLGFWSTTADASIVVGATRIVYEEGMRETTVQLKNTGNRPSLMQAWVDAGNPEATPEDSETPFMLTPPIARLNAEAGQALRIAFIGGKNPLAQDKESVFWLNVLDIPPEPDNKQVGNAYIQVAVRSRIKLFYRPKGLAGEANKAPDAVQWSSSKPSSDNAEISATNPTPYHISITAVGVKNNGQNVASVTNQPYMLAPGERHAFTLPKNIKLQPSATINFTTINDYGGNIEWSKSAMTTP